MFLLRTLTLTAVAAVALLPATSAHATTITAVGSTVIANGGTAPGSSLNYAFFGWQGSPKAVLTDFTVTTYGVTFSGGNIYGYSTLIAPGGTTAYYTGLQYAQTQLATITSLSGGSFNIYILNANQDANGALYDSSIGLGVNGAGESANIASIFQHNTNQFNEFSVTGASPGDTFQVYAHSNAYPSIDGITFEAATSPVPEPSSLFLLGTGIFGVIGAARRKLRNS